MSEAENQRPLFFDSLRISELHINDLLPPLVIKNIRPNKILSSCKIKFAIPELAGLVNVYLFLNGKKKDIFYQLKSGTYTFNTSTAASESLVELFYVTGTNRSQSVFSFLKG